MKSVRARTSILTLVCLFLSGGVNLAQEFEVQGEEQEVRPENPQDRPRAPVPPPPDGIESFGRINWGMEANDVARYLPDGSRGKSGGIRVNMYVGGKPSETYFVFKDDALAIISGRFTKRYSRLNDYVHEYNAIKRVLSKSLGDPMFLEEVWADDGLPQDEKEMGRAVATGRLRLGAWWETDKTYVELRCSGGNYQVSRTVRFQSKEHGGRRRKPPVTAEKTGSDS